MPLSQLLLFTTVGLMIGLYRKSNANLNVLSTNISDKRELTIWKAFNFIILILFMFTLSNIDIRKTLEGTQPELDRIDVHGPRLWYFGGIPH